MSLLITGERSTGEESELSNGTNLELDGGLEDFWVTFVLVDYGVMRAVYCANVKSQREGKNYMDLV